MNQLKKLDEEIQAYKDADRRRNKKNMRIFSTVGIASIVLVGVMWRSLSLVPGVEGLSDTVENVVPTETTVVTTVTTLPENTTAITTTTTPVTTEVTITTTAVTTVTTEEVTTVESLGPGFDYDVPEWISADVRQFPMVDSILSTFTGVNEYGPVGKETYYNLDMSGVLSLMYSQGYSSEEFPYWERYEDGAKMFGPYIMVAANLDVYPKGTILDCSMGKAMVVDKCEAAYYSNVVLDIAVTW